MKRHLLTIFLALTSVVVAQGGTVTLVSSEGDRFGLEESVARLSGVIESILAMTTKDAEGDVIPLLHIPSDCLRAIVKDLEHIHAWYEGQHLNPLSLREHDENSALRTTMEKRYAAETQPFYTDTARTLELLKIADYLNIPELIHRYARDLASQSYENPIATFDSLYGNTYQEVEEVIAYYLKPHMDNILFHDNSVSSAACYLNGKVVTTADRKVRVSDARTGVRIAVIPHDSVVYSVAFSPDGTKVVTGLKNGTARVSDVQTGAQIAVIPHDHGLYIASFLPNGTTVVTGSDKEGKQIYTDFPSIKITDLNQLLVVLIMRKISLDNIDEQVREKIKSVFVTFTEQQQAALDMMRRNTKNKSCNIS